MAGLRRKIVSLLSVKSHSVSFGWNRGRGRVRRSIAPSPRRPGSPCPLRPRPPRSLFCRPSLRLRSRTERPSYPWRSEGGRAEMRDPVEAGTHQEYHVGALQRQGTSRATDSGWSSGIPPLPVRERRNGTCVRSIKARSSSSAGTQTHAVADQEAFQRGRLLRPSG
jgi:hypothetical protein